MKETKLLTEREKQVLTLMANGYDNNQISKTLFISIHTTKAHVSSILQKLGVNNRTVASVIGVKLQIIDINI